MKFENAVRDIVNCIPEGKVLTYSDVAALAGKPSCARQVGKILGCIGFDSTTPCHRVVNSIGRIAPHWPSQRTLLENEGVEFKNCGHVDMKRFRWDLSEFD